jgi:hypothetical protein
VQIDRVLDVLLLLALRVDAVERAAGDDRVAADRLGLLDQEHLRPRVVRLDGRRQPGEAGADDHDVGLAVPFLRRLDRPQHARREKPRSDDAGRDRRAGDQLAPGYPARLLVLIAVHKIIPLSGGLNAAQT